jgi:hypothetical protein
LNSEGTKKKEDVTQKCIEQKREKREVEKCVQLCLLFAFSIVGEKGTLINEPGEILKMGYKLPYLWDRWRRHFAIVFSKLLLVNLEIFVQQIIRIRHMHVKIKVCYTLVVGITCKYI